MTQLPPTAECVIIGGGAIGCSLAYHLAQAGMHPVMLERNSFGSGSTAKCAGGVRQQFSTKVNIEIGMLSRTLIGEFPETIGETAGFREIGYLFLASTDDEANQLKSNVALQQSCGLDEVRYLAPSDAREILPQARMDDVTGATYCPTDGLAGPHELTYGYVHAAQRYGAVLTEDVVVTGIDVEHGGVTGVHTSQGHISTPCVVNAAGPYARDIGALMGIDVPVFPYRRHIFVTQPMTVPEHMPMTVDFHTSFYCHPEGAGLLLGMSDPDEPSSYDTSINWSFLEQLVEKAMWRLPLLEAAEIQTGWAGLYEITPDYHGIVGEDPTIAGAWLCCGFSGHGFMQAPAIGLLMSQQMTGVAPVVDLTPLSPARFGGAPLVRETAVI